MDLDFDLFFTLGVYFEYTFLFISKFPSNTEIRDQNLSQSKLVSLLYTVSTTLIVGSTYLTQYLLSLYNVFYILHHFLKAAVVLIGEFKCRHLIPILVFACSKKFQMFLHQTKYVHSSMYVCSSVDRIRPCFKILAKGERCHSLILCKNGKFCMLLSLDSLITLGGK